MVRKAIESEIKKIESKSLARDLDSMGLMLRKNVSSNEISRAVRSSRNERWSFLRKCLAKHGKKLVVREMAMKSSNLLLYSLFGSAKADLTL